MVALDDPIRLKKTLKLIDQYGEKDVFISYGVLVESYYVLTKRYGIDKEKVLAAFEDFLKIEQFSFEQETAVRLALVKAKKNYGFCDALIGEIGGVKNLKTYTFDKELKSNSSFEVLS